MPRRAVFAARCAPLLVLCCLVSAIAPKARAQSLKDTLAVQALDKALAREAEYTSKRCTAPIAARLGPPAGAGAGMGAAPKPSELLRRCDAALGALETLCARGEEERASVGRHIHEVVCRPGAPRGAGLEKGVLVFVPGEGLGGYRFVLDFLSEALDPPPGDATGAVPAP